MTQREIDDILLGVIPGPVWTDECHHQKEEYIASFEVYERHGDEHKRKFDLYVYEDRWGSEVCMRFGSDGPDYLSSGSVLNIMRHQHDYHEPHHHAAQILASRGTFHWKPKPKENPCS